MSTPENLKYTDSHEWLRQEDDGTVTVGITFHAQDMLGDVVFVQTPEPGKRFDKGAEVGVIESVKAAADIYAPISGEIVAANEEVADAPEKLNEDPYGAWLFRMKPDNAGELGGLLDAAAYRKVAEADKNDT